MNTTTTTTSANTDSQIPTTGRKAYFSTQTIEKNKVNKTLSLRPSRSVKKISSFKPNPLKRA